MTPLQKAQECHTQLVSEKQTEKARADRAEAQADKSKREKNLIEAELKEKEVTITGQGKKIETLEETIRRLKVLLKEKGFELPPDEAQQTPPPNTEQQNGESASSSSNFQFF